MSRPRGAGAVQLAGQGIVQDLLDQRALSGTANARDRDKGAERKLHVDVFEIVLPSPLHSQRGGGRNEGRGARGEGRGARGEGRGARGEGRVNAFFTRPSSVGPFF